MIRKRRLPEDADELRALVGELHRRLSRGAGGGAFFPPLAGVCVAMGYERFRRVLEGQATPGEEDAIGFYALAHEGVHLAQTVTAGWFFQHVLELTRLAGQTLAAVNGGTATAHSVGEARQRFRRLQADLYDEDEGYAALDVIETQAVVEGFWGAAVEPVDDEVAAVALRHHRNSPPAYHRILAHMLETHGARAAIHLTPRLCAIALGADRPGAVIARLLDELDSVRGRTDTLVDLPPERLLGVVGLGAAAFTRSVRENGAWAQARGHAEMALEEIMRGYLERYEALADPRQRLEVRMHPARASRLDSGRRRVMFMPRYVLFGDGRAYEPESSPRNLTDFATWVVIGLMILDGLDYLDSGDLPA